MIYINAGVYYTNETFKQIRSTLKPIRSTLKQLIANLIELGYGKIKTFYLVVNYFAQHERPIRKLQLLFSLARKFALATM